MDDDPRQARVETIVNAFFQNKSMEQRQDYLTRGRRFANVEVGRLNADWILGPTMALWQESTKRTING